MELNEFGRLAWILRADTGGFAEERSVDVAAFPVELAGDTDGVSGEFSEDPGSCSGKASADRCCITHPLDKSRNSCPRGLTVETILERGGFDVKAVPLTELVPTIGQKNARGRITRRCAVYFSSRERKFPGSNCSCELADDSRTLLLSR